MAAILAAAAGAAVALDYRVFSERPGPDYTAYTIKCDNGKERTVVYSNWLKKFYYGTFGLGQPHDTLDSAARWVCENT